jgi:hypothetical protein
LENELGWEPAVALDDPSAFAEFSVDGLADVAGTLGSTGGSFCRRAEWSDVAEDAVEGARHA